MRRKRSGPGGVRMTASGMLARAAAFWQPWSMARTILIYALALAAAAALLDWLEYRYVTRAYSIEIYIGLVALCFVALGVWAGRKLTPAAAPAAFERNEAAIRSLGLSPRECEILELLASGQSNKELARTLRISPNTIKTHVARVYEKLDVSRRIAAVEKARMLRIIS